jgi:hypothetical protein
MRLAFSDLTLERRGNQDLRLDLEDVVIRHALRFREPDDRAGVLLELVQLLVIEAARVVDVAV